MKIILINRFFYPDQSATSQLLCDLAFGLAAGGREVHVITSRQRYDDPKAELPARDVVDGVRVHRVWTSRFGRDPLAGRTLDYLSFYLSATHQIWRLARRDDVVVAETDPPLISVLAAVVCGLRKAWLVNWLQDLFPEVAEALHIRGLRGWPARLLQRLRNWSLRRARANVVLGKSMAARLAASGIDASRVTVVENWADGSAICPVKRGRNERRKSWRLDGKFVIGYSGNMGRGHEFQTILKAAEFLKGFADIGFLFIGSGVHLPWIRSEVRRRHLTEFTLLPYQPRESLAESLCVPDIHLVSIYPDLEGLIVPSKFYGIAAAGRPTLYVGDPDGEMGRLICEADCGVVFKPGQVMEIAESVLTLAAQPGLCRKMGANARALFEQRFDKHVAIRKWQEVFDGVRSSEASLRVNNAGGLSSYRQAQILDSRLTAREVLEDEPAGVSRRAR